MCAGRDLVGRDVVAQLGIALRMRGVPRQVFARELTLDELRIFGEEKDSPLQLHPVGALGNSAVQQRVSHLKILSQKADLLALAALKGSANSRRHFETGPAFLIASVTLSATLCMANPTAFCSELWSAALKLPPITSDPSLTFVSL